MPDAPLGVLSEFLSRLADPPKAATDADLLARFDRDRDEQAFARLVDRYGPLVLGVCRRALGPTPDADDAFQATFLAVARSAARIRTNLPGWLYRVAIRACRKAARRLPPSTLGEPVDPNDQYATVEWRDVRRVLDEELGRLPEKLRSPLLLCHVQGLTRDEAAARLGWSLRTLHRRLEDGRRVLRARLVRRGLGPALLAAAVLSPAALQAHVPETLAHQAAGLAARDAPVSASIRALVPRVHSLGGWTMNAVVSALVLAGGTILVVASRQPAEAQPAPRPLPSIATPVPARVKPGRPPEDALSRSVRTAQEKGIAYLKAQQKDKGDGMASWENDNVSSLQRGGTSSLALLALLENGIKVDDPMIARGLKYLRTVEPRNTYVVALQTQVYCRANQKDDADRIKRNVRWLEDAAVRNGGVLQGWSYTQATETRADNSNSRYAVAALYAAHKAGFKPTKVNFWKEVRDLYVRTQKADGGWGYVPETPKPTHTMTGSGLLSLYLAKDVLGDDDRESGPAIEGGLRWVGENLRFEYAPYTFYNFDVIAALGRASDLKSFGSADKKRAWYREGAEWLLRNQNRDGDWKKEQALDNYSVISTSFALRFLASRPD